MMKTINFILEKYLTILFLMMSSTLMFAQDVFYFQKESFFKNHDTGINTGKTDISVPLLSVPTLKKNLKINVGLAYDIDNVSTNSLISDVGSGWNMLNGGGSITKFISTGLNDNGELVYQYSFPGQNGRFIIKKDLTQNTIARELYPSKNKILIQKQSDTIFTSFKIIDENGYTYIFDKKNVSARYEYPRITHFPTGEGHFNQPSAKKEPYTSAFLLSQILDEKNNLIVSYEFDVTQKTYSAGKQIIINKVNKINITGVGTINFNYYKDSYSEFAIRDNYSLNSLTLTNKSNRRIKKFNFTYSNSLDNVSERDSNDIEINNYNFEYYPLSTEQIWLNRWTYDKYGYQNNFDACHIDYDYFYTSRSVHAENFKTGFLKSVKFPSGGKTVYEYESNKVPANPSLYPDDPGDLDAEYEINKLIDTDYNSQQQSEFNIPITSPSDYSQFILKIDASIVDTITFPHTNPTYYNYTIKKADGSAVQLYDFKDSFTDKKCPDVKSFSITGSLLNNPNFKLRIDGPQASGHAKFFGIRKTKRNFVLAKGGRIRSIKTYEKDMASPSRVLKFDYNLFSDPNKSSGEIYLDVPEYTLPETNGWFTDGGESFKRAQEVVLYKNVKVTDSIKNTSAKYTYMTPNEIDSLAGAVNPGTLDLNFTLKKLGLAKKVEKFDANNVMIEKNENIYNFEYIMYNQIVDFWNNPFKLLYLKSTSNNSQVKVDNTSNMLSSSGQNFFEPEYNLLTRSLSTDFSGSVSEQKLYYPKDLSNQKLINANIVGVPLKTEIFQDGNFMGRSEMKFDDPATVYPTSQITYNLQTQTPQTFGTIESYDDIGNVREVKSQDNISTVTIWGYHKTQPIAVIVGASYIQIQNLSVIAAAVAASDLDDNNSANEPALIQALDDLRKDNALKNYQITTYTYDPLIGITSTTSSSGIRQINVYDNANRLLKVIDDNGKTLKEFKYNYKNQ